MTDLKTETPPTPLSGESREQDPEDWRTDTTSEDSRRQAEELFGGHSDDAIKPQSTQTAKPGYGVASPRRVRPAQSSHVLEDTPDVDLSEPLPALIQALVDFGGRSPANIPAKWMRESEKAIRDACSEARFIEILQAVKLDGGRWQDAILAAWEEPKKRVAKSSSSSPADNYVMSPEVAEKFKSQGTTNE